MPQLTGDMKFQFEFINKRTKKLQKKHLERYDSVSYIPEDLTEEFDVPFAGRDGNVLTANIFRPKEPGTDRLPVIVLLHGGGLFLGKPIIARAACEELARRGYLVYAPSYRLMFDADIRGEVRDACAGLDFAVGTMEERGGDPDRVFMMGDSAGGLLAVYATALSSSPKLQEIMDCAPSRADIKAICFVSGMFYTTRKDLLGISYPSAICGDLRKDKEFMSYMDPENPEVLNNLPPSILTSSRCDPLRNYTLRFHRALVESGADSSLVYYGLKNRQLFHAFVVIRPELRESREAFDIICKWFEDHSVSEKGKLQ